MAIDDASEHVSEICLRIDVVEFAGLDERGDGGPVLGSAIGTCEERILAIEGDGADRSFDDVVVDLDAAVVDEESKALPARERVADCFREFCLLADRREFSTQPRIERVDDRTAFLLPNGATLIGAASADVLLNGVKGGNARKRFICDRRGVRRSELVEAAADMRPAASREPHLSDRSPGALQGANDCCDHASVCAATDPHARTIKVEAYQRRLLIARMHRIRADRIDYRGHEEVLFRSPGGSNQVTCLTSPGKKLRRRQAVPSGNITCARVADIAFRNDRCLMLRAPLATPASTREHLHPPSRDSDGLRHEIITWHRHMSKLRSSETLSSKRLPRRCGRHTAYLQANAPLRLLAHLHAPEFRLPRVERRFTHPVLAA